MLQSRTGVRTKLGESTSKAVDGNPVFISMGGDSTRMPTSTMGVQYYGWETVHEQLIVITLGVTGELVGSKYKPCGCMHPLEVFFLINRPGMETQGWSSSRI